MFEVNERVLSAVVTQWIIKEAIKMTILNDNITQKDLDKLLNRVYNGTKQFSAKQKQMLELIGNNVNKILDGGVVCDDQRSK